jgi:hypothetical protein
MKVREFLFFRLVWTAYEWLTEPEKIADAAHSLRHNQLVDLQRRQNIPCGIRNTD